MPAPIVRIESKGVNVRSRKGKEKRRARIRPSPLVSLQRRESGVVASGSALKTYTV
jgi:hypothetical protein